MFSLILSLFLLQGPPTDATKTFKKEAPLLQGLAETEITSTGAQVLQHCRAAYLEGYGVVLTMEVAFEGAQSPFSGYKKPEEIKALVTQRRTQVKEKMITFVQKRVATSDTIGPNDSLSVVIHVLNANPVEVRDLPMQILISSKKDAAQPTFKELY